MLSGPQSYIQLRLSNSIQPELRRDVIIGAGVTATVNITLEAFALCNFGCTLGHEARIGAGSVVNPGANISGGVVIGTGVFGRNRRTNPAISSHRCGRNCRGGSGGYS